ncbi:hypothetical protein G6F66_014010 [Rhizopus arrhizus]|nr:hypothetical protein G6F66_014010 [Rhizopus arrhizus]
MSRSTPSSSDSRSDPLIQTSRRAWLGVLAVGLATCSVVTTEMLPVGLLVPITGDLHVSVGEGGLMLFVPAILAALFAPLGVGGAKGADRRWRLCGLLAMLTAANLASALAPNYATMLLARFVAGLPHGAYFGVAMLVAAAISPAGQRGQAMSRVLLGLS